MMQNEIAVGYRLSPQQKRIWKLLEADPRAPYRSLVALSIEGMLNETRLTDALREVVNRHEILRTSYPVHHGLSLPLQTISEAGLLYTEADLSDLPEPHQQSRLERLFEEEKRRPLDFKGGENLRATLVRLSPTSNVLLINVPAITSDGAGLDNLVGEVISLYQDPQAGASLQEPLQYADYSEWQNQLLEAEETRAGRDYWRRADFRNPAALKLPFENRLASESGFAPGVLSKTIEPETLDGIEALAARAEASVASVLLAGWHALLWRTTDDDGIIVGACYEGRRFEGLGDAVGLFEKYLPIRCRLDDRQEFLDVVKSVEESARAAELWQESFAWEHLGDFQEAGDEKPFFPFLFDFREGRLERSSGELDFSIYRRYSCTDRSSIRLSCRRDQGKLTLDFHYDSALVRDESVRRLAGRFETLMQSAVSNPLSKVTRLNLLNLAEDREMAEWNRTERDYPRGACAHELFEQQARQTPDAVALEFAGETLTYRELDERANRLANHLVSLGVGPEVIVGVCLERSFDLIVALFGILKAGGAYLPLDSAYPNQRLEYMAKDAGIRVLLTQSSLLDNFSHLVSHVVCLDSSRQQVDSLSPLRP
ncbi:MAG TPA: condensation domain-containing protein, partial [Blastocatellia bacterium]|nr:condensation domain-containing protein [Blastocatellia bacterium]